uniref:DUF4743 domain-containing protein n=1 Tax=Hippocampus comes TaxID=109280 RepID=A0A3Q2Y345_HIPCM
MFAGSGRANCLRFEVNGIKVGWIAPHVTALLARYGDVFQPPLGGALSLSEAVADVLSNLRRDPSLRCLKGWRDERFNVIGKFSDPPVMWMERAATSLFGVKCYGVHINGYTVSETGDLCMWLARRSPTKPTYPGRLDNMVSTNGSQPAAQMNTLAIQCVEKHITGRTGTGEEELCVIFLLNLSAFPLNKDNERQTIST